MTTPAPQSSKSGFFRTLRTVGSAMIGVRGRKLHEQDAPALSPIKVLITALLFMLVFVFALVSIAISVGRQ